MHRFMCPAPISNSATNCFPIQGTFVRFSLLRLFRVSKPEEMIRKKKIHHQRAPHRRNRDLFWRVRQIILFGRLEKIEESLDQMYRAMLRNKNELIKKMCFFYIFLKKTCPRNLCRIHFFDKSLNFVRKNSKLKNKSISPDLRYTISSEAHY